MSAREYYAEQSMLLFYVKVLNIEAQSRPGYIQPPNLDNSGKYQHMTHISNLSNSRSNYRPVAIQKSPTAEELAQMIHNGSQHVIVNSTSNRAQSLYVGKSSLPSKIHFATH